jgi:mono/diheme cytochrome c family protein
MPRWIASVALVFLFGSSALAAPVDYVHDIKPLLTQHCVKCHGPDKQQSDLRVDSLAAMLQGGNTGPALIAGKSGESLLIDALTKGENVSKMPPEGNPKLTAAQIDLLKRWIDEGAKGPKEEPPQVATVKKNDHWAFRPLTVTTPPQVKHTANVRHDLDRFVLAKLESAGMKPSPEADRATLIRRLSLDLTGLPQSIAEVDDFVNDKADGAYERLVDRLLASPHYGERWGRHWLDQARYADSNGYTIDSARAIWKYRDWVIDAVNRDLPFDQFTIDQLAGDMLPQATLEQKIATGFHRNTLRNEEGGTDQEQFRVEAVVDRISTVGSVWLGMTIGCARCHDHKYDPISQREFYQIFALFNNADEPTLAVPTNEQAKEEAPLLADIAGVEKRLAEVDSNSGQRQVEWEAKIKAEYEALVKDDRYKATAAILAPLYTILKIPPKQRSLAADRQKVLAAFQAYDPERQPLMVQLAELNDRKKQLQAKITTTLVMTERAEPRETFVHLRGDFLRHGAKVSPAVPAVLPPLKAAKGTPNRLDFARWLVDKQNPLTPRVTVNRVWQAYFGQGLVTTENDFGTTGEKPSHPELLDWLASEFIKRGWSMKQLHRLIVTSGTYRQASAFRSELREQDPYNKLLARQSRLRLEAEIIRDSALVASGLLVRDIGGPGVYPPQPDGIYRFTQNVKYWKERAREDRYRRGMYTYFWRSSPYPFLMTFDAPDANTACTRRVRSNTPLQALTLANDQAFVEFAQGLAHRIEEQAKGDDRAKLQTAFRWCLVREPQPRELDRLSEFLAAQRKQVEKASDAWVAVARVLLNLDEFVTRE